ncbi:phage terminase large subunit family protein [Roseomonas frigidaquae]|uniref:Phage terminase large subunit family protein n=2 Tax=Falsiroseomonas frigidaquae TaxID=487318 RepID=A0ABX1ES82_9PROT|nr:terminase gpA endonuclease subunit [Falsiroseomonas frigidaquae]NKE43393.1 phage terminase large subunit family protein [Falsiroseomonas frigidaquae]
MQTRTRLPSTPKEIPYANPARLALACLDGWLPRTPISVADHAEQKRWVKAANGAHLERWDHGTAPYTCGPMEALTENGIETVAIVGPAASGKTAGPAESWLLQTIEADPADMLWYMQTEDAVASYVKGRIEPLLDAHDKLIGPLRLGRDSITMKRFRGGRVEFLPFTHSALVNKHVQKIIADEWDAYDPNVGDPEELLNFRRQAAGADSKLLAISHPDLALPLGTPPERQRGIMRLYAKSDRRTWWWPCPHCGAHSSPNPGTTRRMVIHYDDQAPLEEIESSARLLCPVNGCLIEDGHRHAMNRGGRWLRAGEEMDEDGRIAGRPVASRIAGFWIVGAMSAFVMGGIGALARNRVAAERAVAAGGDVQELRTIVVKGWGEPLDMAKAVGSVDAAALVERADDRLRLGTVPPWVRFLTAWADAQGNRWELLVRGWGAHGESTVVQHQVIPGEPASSAEGWDGLLAMLAETAFPIADGTSRVMRIRAAGYDAFGQPGVTEQAYAAWLRRWRAGGIRRLGEVDSKVAFSLIPTKGDPRRGAARLLVTWPNSQRKDRKATAGGQIPLLLFSANMAKDALAAQLAVLPPAPNAVHLPKGLLSRTGPPHPFVEQLTVETRNPVTGMWTSPPGARNEATDLMVGCEVIARLHGLHRIDWTRPPAWAAPLESNSMVTLPTQSPPEAVRLPALPSATAPRPAPPATALPPPPVMARTVARRRAVPSSYMG